MPIPTLAPVLMFGIVAASMFRRMRRQFGKQPLNPGPIKIRLAILGVVAIALIVVAIMRPDLALPLTAGLGGGALIAGINLRLTAASNGRPRAMSTIHTLISVWR